LLATSTNAGDAFRLAGFYPSLQGGALRLQIALDGRNAQEQHGVIEVKNFQVLGDPVLQDVIQSPAAARPTISQADGRRRQRRRVVQEVVQFDTLKAPFSIGYGQFVLHDAQLTGPLLGGTIRGIADFARGQLDLGGTYSALQALNTIPSFLPGLGDIMTGPRKEGIFAMTFAVQGPMASPEVLVNPFSALAPGITREIFQMAPATPRLTPRAPITPKDSEGGNRGWGATSRQSNEPFRSPDRTVGGWQPQTVPKWRRDTFSDR